MNVKRILRWTLVLACLLPIFSVMAQDSTSTAEPTAEATAAMAPLPDLGGRSVSVAIENAYPPFNYIDTASGEAIGWDYDMINEMCSRLNCTPEFVQVSWEGMIVAVAGGEYDMAADGISITDERAKQVDYSIPYITTIQRFMVRKDETRFTTAQSIIDDTTTKVSTQLATTNYELATKLVGEDRIIGTSDFGSAVQALIAGDVDAVIIDDVAGQGYVGANAEAVKLIPDELSSDPLGFIFPKGSDLVAPMNAALQSMMADKTLARISAFWGLGAPVETVSEILKAKANNTKAPEFTKLLAAAQVAGSNVVTMDPNKSYTLFAPSDAAFAKLPAETLDMLMKDPVLLGHVLSYHIVEGSVLSSALTSGDVKTVEGDTIAVAVADDGSITVNGANVTLKDVKATDGVIHIIDTVLLPPDVAAMLPTPEATAQP